jgi:hypothetical protein
LFFRKIFLNFSTPGNGTKEKEPKKEREREKEKEKEKEKDKDNVFIAANVHRSPGSIGKPFSPVYPTFH